MSVENGKVCCNCRHDIRIESPAGINCYCEIDGHYIGYVECHEGWCRHWAKEYVKTENGYKVFNSLFNDISKYQMKAWKNEDVKIYFD